MIDRPSRRTGQPPIDSVRGRIPHATHEATRKGASKATHSAAHPGNAKKSPRKRGRIRSVPYIFTNQRLDERLMALLDDADPRLRMYVYRVENGRKTTPALFVSAPFPNLLDHLRDKHRGGHFVIMIRRGKVIELSGAMGIEAPISSRQPTTGTK